MYRANKIKAYSEYFFVFEDFVVFILKDEILNFFKEEMGQKPSRLDLS
jgi:hypothetical protein